MSENMDLDSNNLCIPEDAFDQFQAVSMYQEEKYITLTELEPTKPKDPDPGELSHLSYDNEVVVTTDENEVNSTVNDNSEMVESSEQQTLDSSNLDTSVEVDDCQINLDQSNQVNQPPKVSTRGRKKKIATDVTSKNNVDNLISNETVNNIQISLEEESPITSSSLPPRRRGRKPKPRPSLPIEQLNTTQNHEVSSISITPFSSDPENSDASAAVVRKKRGRPRKAATYDKELSSEFSGSDNNLSTRLDTPRKRGRPRKVSLESNLDSNLKHFVQSPTNDHSSIKQFNEVDLNKTQPVDSFNQEIDPIELELQKLEQEPDNKLHVESDKILTDASISRNDDLDNLSLSQLKELPDSSKSIDENCLDENNKRNDSENISSDYTNLDTLSHENKKKGGRPKKKQRGRPKTKPLVISNKSDPIIESIQSNNVIQNQTTQADDDDMDDLSLSKLKEQKDDSLIENYNKPEVDTKGVAEIVTKDDTTEDTKNQIMDVENSNTEVSETPTKRNTKMPIMTDFEYNVDSVIDHEAIVNENADNSLLVVDKSKRPIRRKVTTLRYEEESDEDPFANVELSDDDDEPRRKKRYYSDDEYVPGRRGNKDIDSTDSEADELLGEEKKQKKNNSRKKPDNHSPRKKGKKEEPKKDEESDDVEICMDPAVVKVEHDSQNSLPSAVWGTSNEFENFLAKKIQGTNLQIKKVSLRQPTQNKTLEIPVIDPDAKKTFEMSSQTNCISTHTSGTQTGTPYDIPMKRNIPLSPEQSKKACHFLNSIVKTTSELGTLMTQKSEDFIKKKINTTHVTDTMKMDYCVKKSFLLFKLAKHNLLQMEEDLAKQYDEFLTANNLTECREVPKKIIPSAKRDSSDSDCEIVEEPVKAQSQPKTSQDKDKFNLKTVFLNKELSIKIAKKPTDTKKLDIKGRHTVWINDTVMVKKVKPTQSFLAQDSRNKKPPDNKPKITTDMVSNFFKNYYRQKSLAVCAPFISTDWLKVRKECVCNYFVVKPIGVCNNINHSENGGISMNSSASNASASETSHDLNTIKNKTKNITVTCPEPLFKLCLRILKNQSHDLNHVKEINTIVACPEPLFKLCFRIVKKQSRDLNYVKEVNTIITCPESLFKLCFRIVKNQIRDMNHVKKVYHQVRNEITDEKEEPVTLSRLCLRALTDRLVNNMERSPTPSEYVPPDVASQNPVLPLTKLCHREILDLLSKSNKKESRGEQETVSETRCSTENFDDFYTTSTIKYKTSYTNFRNEIKSLLSLCVEFIQKRQLLETNEIILIPKPLRSLTFECVKQLLYRDLKDHLPETSQVNLNHPVESVLIEGVTINCVNTLSEEAFLNLEQSPDSHDEYEDFNNDESFEPDFSDFEDNNQTEPSWVSQVQMKELRSCINTNNVDIDQPPNISIVTQIKLEPLDEVSENIPSPAHVKCEPGPGLDEMTLIPDVIKPEVVEDVIPETIQRQNSSSYDVDAFEQFVSSNKLLHELTGDIYSQSALRVRRQHEPDYHEEYDPNMSLLIPQTYEPLTIETAKGSLMESSSDEESSKTKKAAGKKKPDKRKGKQKKPDPKTTNKDIPTPTTLAKEKVTNNEVATLTKRMRDKIRQEEKKDDSTDSESESLNLRLRNRKEIDKSKPAPTNKTKEREIQCNNVDSTDQVDDDVANFSGFTAIDQNEISTYQKYMQFVYDKIIPDNEESPEKNTAAKENKDNNISEAPIINHEEPVELLECEPTMPFFDDIVSERRTTRKSKGKIEVPKKELTKKEELLKKEEITKNELLTKEKEETTKIKEISKEPDSFTDRHGWHCYPVNTKDSKLYLSACIALEKLPESFVQTYFEYQGITRKDENDEEIDRLTNLNSLNRTAQLKDIKSKIKSKKEEKGEHTSGKSSEAGSRADSPTFSDHYELEPSDDEGNKVEDQAAPPVAQRHTENTLAKNLLMDDNESDGDEPATKVKEEPLDGTSKPRQCKPSIKPKHKEMSVEDSAELMLTADKMMNKELNLLHAPIVLNDEVKETPSKGPMTRNKQKSAAKNQASSTKTKNEEEYSSEEEKQWVTTKEKLLKRLGKKEDASVDDAKRAKLVSEFIERRSEFPESHKRSCARSRRSAKKFLERQKQLRVLSRELFGEPSTRSQKAQASMLYKGRRNIRKVIDKKSLARSTVVANMEEFERKRRLNARQTKLRELLGCEEGVNVLVINDEVCLEYDFEENRPVVTIHPFFTKVMKAHQYEGVKFMWDACFESLAEVESGHPGGGCILAHCMGLGKTLQVLALLHTVLTHPRVGMHRILVCCPLSTVLNWVDEIHKWIGPVTNQIKVFELSKLKKTYERAYQLEDWYNGGGIFIIGYELFRSLSTLDPFLDDVRPTIINKIRTALLDPGPDIIVCDEGHLLKNDCSVLAVAMSRVVTKRRIMLTGTPMQNNLREYYCMVNFVKPNLLGTYAEYSNRFENPIMNGQHRDSREEDIKLMKARTHILHKVLEGCLQRQEASVLYPYLPKKHEYTVFITLTQCQWDLYKHYLGHYAKQSKQSILKDFHILQKIWSHPQVLHHFQTKGRDERNKVKAEKLEDDLATEDIEEIKPNTTELWWLEYLEGGNMLETLDSSNKFVVVFRILDECVALGDKVLIFSTSLFCLDAVEYFLKKINNWSLGQEYYRLDGSVPAEVRQKWCREFNADNNTKTKLFLVSTRAGCLGLNMTAANRVIIMDTSWNPAHDIQSIFRVYRFGQKKDCYIYRLVAMGTMEQKIYERSVTKQAVACRVVDEQQIDRHYNMAELTELYKFDEAGLGVAGGVAVGVHDVVLLRVARLAALHAVHEHDSLLRGSSEQGLPEHERNAAWMQFQQEQTHKQIENKLVVNIPYVPKISLKRLHGHEYASTSSAPEIKTEDKSDDFAPNEPKAKKGKKNAFIKCSIPIQDCSNSTETKKETMFTRGRTKKDAVKPSTSKEPIDDAALQWQEEAMVEKITDILLKHNFQHRKGNMEISNLITRVRNIVKKGFVNHSDLSDDLTASIARILLPKQISIPKVTDIMCESINNSAAPPHRINENPEVITCDTPSISEIYTHKSIDSEPRMKRKAAIAAEKSIDSLAQDIVINLDDDDWDAEDRDFVPDTIVTPDKQNVNNRGKKKSKGKDDSPVRNLDDDERTISAGSSPQRIDIDVDLNLDYVTPGTSKVDKDNVVKQDAVNKVKPKDRPRKMYTKKVMINDDKINNDFQSQINEKNKSKNVTSNSILLSDDDELTALHRTSEKKTYKPGPKISKRKQQLNETPHSIDLRTTEVLSDDDSPLKTSELTVADYSKTYPTVTEKNTQKTVGNPEVQHEKEEIVPLPLSLLKNQNFINIVAHTYLVGNPMLDEDAATLAAQYSTLKAFKEAEQTGKNVCSGPIYDIAVKVIGKDILKKMSSVNPVAASTSAVNAEVNIQRKEKLITTEKTKSSKNKSDLRDEMIKQKLGMKQPMVEEEPNVTLTPVSRMSNKHVVPVGLVKTMSGVANGSFSQAGVECILPDDDNVIISDEPNPVISAINPNVPNSTIVPTSVAASKKPIILNHAFNSRIVHQDVHPVKVTVGGSATLAPTTQPTAPTILRQRHRKIAAANSTTITGTPTNLEITSIGPIQQITPSTDTICLDSDDEETSASVLGHPISTASALKPLQLAQAPVPVSLTMANAPGIKLPLPAMPNLVPANPSQPAPQTLVLHQVTGVGSQPKFILISSDQIPMPALHQVPIHVPPITTTSSLPKVAIPAQYVNPAVAPKKPSIIVKSNTVAKPASIPPPTNTIQAMPNETLSATQLPELSKNLNQARCKPGDILRISKTGQIEVINRNELLSATPSIDLTNLNQPTVANPIAPNPAPPNPIAPKPTLTKTIAPKFTTSKLTTSKPNTSKPTTSKPTTSKPVASQPSTSTSIDLTNLIVEAEGQKTLSPPLSETTSQKKTVHRKRIISSSSSSSSSRASSPENPLSILKDVIHIRAADYPTPATSDPTRNTSNSQGSGKSIVLRTEKCSNSNISVQHVVSSDTKSSSASILKLTPVPKEKVPKDVDIKKVTPLTKPGPKSTQKPTTKPKVDIKLKEKQTVSVSSIISDNAAAKRKEVDRKIAEEKKRADERRKTDDKRKTETSNAILKGMLKDKKAPLTVDLTKMISPGTSLLKPKSQDIKRRPSIAESPIKKKRSEPMTLKDFNLDDIDDIIELE